MAMPISGGCKGMPISEGCMSMPISRVCMGMPIYFFLIFLIKIYSPEGFYFHHFYIQYRYR